MTDDEALAAVEELRGLERLHAVIALQSAPALEWRYALVALADRIRWIRYCLQLEDPERLDRVEARYHALRRRALLEPAPAWSADRAPGAIH